jgi:osmotically-inducible protein OsmY
VDAAIEQTQEAASSSATALSDTAITTRVKTRLATDKELESMDIQVQTQDGRVVLRGTAPNASAQLRAKELASSVEGAQAVDNLLTIKQP